MAIEERAVEAEVGDLWVSVLGTDDPYPRLREIFAQLYRPGKGAAGFADGPWLHLVDKRGGLMFSALIHKPADGGPVQVRAMYPYTESGYLWPVAVNVVERASKGTAAVLGTVGPAAIGLFDTIPFKRPYAQAPEPFQVSAIALRLDPEELDRSRFADEFCAYAPARRDSKDTTVPADVVEVHSRIEAVEPASFWGVPLTRYLLTLAHVPDHPLTLDVYANDAQIGRRFAVGDRVAGFVWLFGSRP
jgi:hypothetical protein